MGILSGISKARDKPVNEECEEINEPNELTKMLDKACNNAA